MGIIERIYKKTQRFNVSDEPTIGIAPGERPGDISVWVNWDAAYCQLEAFRVVVKVSDTEHKIFLDAITYTFEPSYDSRFIQSLEMPYEIRELLRGKNRASQGEFVFDFILSTGTLTKTLTLKEALQYYLARGGKAGGGTPPRRPIAKDTFEIAQLKVSELKAHSDNVLKALAEKKAKEEAERKAKEEAIKAAAQKATEAEKAQREAAQKGAAGPKVEKQGGGPTLQGGRVALFYGSTTGNTGQIAEMIKVELGGALDHVKSITDISPLDFTVPEILILGIPTWHIGELQDDWATMVPEVIKLELKGKKMAIFGLGDGKGYAETYVDAMHELCEAFESRGAKLFGLWATSGYEFKKSKAIRDGKFLGLVIDVENQHDQSENRVKAWVKQLRGELGI